MKIIYISFFTLAIFFNSIDFSLQGNLVNKVNEFVRGPPQQSASSDNASSSLIVHELREITIQTNDTSSKSGSKFSSRSRSRSRSPSSTSSLYTPSERSITQSGGSSYRPKSKAKEPVPVPFCYLKDVLPDTIDLYMQDGSTYLGEIRTFHDNEIPEWLQHKKYSSTFSAYIKAIGSSYYMATIEKRKLRSRHNLAEHGPWVALIHLEYADRSHMSAGDFHVYNVSNFNHNHNSSPHDYSENKYIYLNVPADETSTVYRSILKEHDRGTY